MGQKKKADQAEEGKGRGGKKATARIQKKKNPETKEIIYLGEEGEEKSHNHDEDQVDDLVKLCCSGAPTKQLQIRNRDRPYPVLSNAASTSNHHYPPDLSTAALA